MPENKLKLLRPAFVFDTETTGIDPATDRIVEICIIKIMPDLSETTITRRLNPVIHIPKESSDIHGITDDMVKDMPMFANIAKALYNLIEGCDIIGYNSNNFDIPLLYNELLRAGIIWNLKGINRIDVGNIFKIKEERTLGAASRFYLGEELDGGHSAEIDTICTKRVFLAQLERYDDVASQTIEELDLFSNFGKKKADINNKFHIDDNGDYVINFSKNKGKLAKENLGFLKWMIECTEPPFPPDTVAIAQRVIDSAAKIDEFLHR